MGPYPISRRCAARFRPMVFGESLQEIGPLLEEFEVIPDWGYYPPFPYSPTRLQAAMTRLITLLESPKRHRARLPLAPRPAEYRRDLRYFADLFRRLASVAITVEEVTSDAHAAGLIPAKRSDLVSLDELEEWLAQKHPPSRNRLKLEELSARLLRLDVRDLIERILEQGIRYLRRHSAPGRPARRGGDVGAVHAVPRLAGDGVSFVAAGRRPPKRRRPVAAHPPGATHALSRLDDVGLDGPGYRPR